MARSSSPDDDRRHTGSVYDAVAGRLGYEGFLHHQQHLSAKRDAADSRLSVAPEDVLFSRIGAPERYAEDDVYDLDRHLKPGQTLPDSDLLKTIHAYAADFYQTFSKEGDSNIDTHSMDETALLAFGILLEEAAAEALSKTGDLALVEAADEHREDGLDDFYWSEIQRKRKVIVRTEPRRRVKTQTSGTRAVTKTEED